MDRMLVSSVRGMGCTCASIGLRFFPFVSPSTSAVVRACVVHDGMPQLAFIYAVVSNSFSADPGVFAPFFQDLWDAKDRGGKEGGEEEGDTPHLLQPARGGENGRQPGPWKRPPPSDGIHGGSRRTWTVDPTLESIDPAPSSSVLALRFFFSFLLSFSCPGLVLRTCWDSIPVSPTSTSIEGGRTTSIEPSFSASPPTFDRSTRNGGRNGGGDTHSTNKRRSKRHTSCTIARGETRAIVEGSQERLEHGEKDIERRN